MLEGRVSHINKDGLRLQVPGILDNARFYTWYSDQLIEVSRHERNRRSRNWDIVPDPGRVTAGPNENAPDAGSATQGVLMSHFCIT